MGYFGARGARERCWRFGWLRRWGPGAKEEERERVDGDCLAMLDGEGKRVFQCWVNVIGSGSLKIVVFLLGWGQIEDMQELGDRPPWLRRPAAAGRLKHRGS